MLKGGLVGNYAHHSCFIAAVFLQMQHGSTYFPHMFPLFYIGEISTIFLDLRFFFHKFGKGSGLLFDLNQGESLISLQRQIHIQYIQEAKTFTLKYEIHHR